MERKKKRGRGRIRIVWALALCLLLMTIPTFALLGARLGTASSREKNVIVLVPGGKEEERLAGSSLRASYLIKEPSHLVDEGQNEARLDWETTADVDLFRAAYGNDGGEPSVGSSNGEKVIAPGTENDYHFSVKNTGSTRLDYTLDLGSSFDSGEESLPFQVRMRKGEEWLVGGLDSWMPVSALDGVADSGSLDSNSNANYVVQWRWPFESGEGEALAENDQNDTRLGSSGEDVYVNFGLTITVSSTALLPDVAPDQPDTNPDQPGDNPDQPGTVPAQPGGNPAQPGTAPDQPGGNPAQPGVNPDQLGDNPNQPGVDLVPPERDPDEEARNELEQLLPDETPLSPGDFLENILDTDAPLGIMEFGKGMPWLWPLLLLLLIFLLVLRRGINVAGYVEDVSAGLLQCRRKKDSIRPDGRFLFKRVHFGKQTFELCDSKGAKLAGMEWKLKRDRQIEGLCFRKDKENAMTVFAGKGIRTIELYLWADSEGRLQIRTEDWAAVDRKIGVYTPEGRKEPDENRCNVTPGLLHIDRRGRLGLEDSQGNVVKA